MIVQHFINSSWPNSKKCNQSACKFHYMQKLALFWGTRSDENKWGKSSHWTGKPHTLLCRAHRNARVCFTLVTVSEAFASAVFCTHRHKGREVCTEKCRQCQAKTTLPTSCHYKATTIKQYYWNVHRGGNFKEEPQTGASSAEEHPTVSCLLYFDPNT